MIIGLPPAVRPGAAGALSIRLSAQPSAPHSTAVLSRELVETPLETRPTGDHALGDTEIAVVLALEDLTLFLTPQAGDAHPRCHSGTAFTPYRYGYEWEW